METIISGTTTGRLVRTILLLSMFTGYAAWSLYDGYVAYPRANIEAVFRTKLGLPLPAPPPRPDAAITPRAVDDLASGLDQPRIGIDAGFGSPAIEHEDRAYYFGSGGYVTVESRGGAARRVEWTDGPVHSPASIGFQKLIGWMLLPVVLLMLVRLSRIARERTILTAETLTIHGRPTIPLESIISITQTAPGRFDLTIRQGGQTATVRLDDYVIEKTPEIVRAIAARHGWPDPLIPPDRP